ncbi:MAG TPA: phosphoribosyl-AMP cyclohydrolase [Spirochaetota bacterium]|mgnify:FL=1|nr:phosphoribosyl-AMP cyclohydrolase [Spirochaetota bacterium]HQG41683.1 phosphoribosyl-AMP cyclohydrolase [Spirochaetota bacterium]HQI37292.1 phosphoribosyl-AMP cyclohydrolase [Spirochaetota bacterium]HQQ50318.1 phosphoribosyl-AMP cyclohydrolase [Spirochaetota bacterium]
MIQLDFTKLDGLVPAVAQDYKTGEILMVAFMNEEAFELTLKTGIVHYWSRSRKTLWKKGESSGNVQQVKEIRIDCDNDCVLLKINQIGDAACHTGYRSCFYRVVEGDGLTIDGIKIFNPEDKYGDKK